MLGGPDSYRLWLTFKEVALLGQPCPGFIPVGADPHKDEPLGFLEPEVVDALREMRLLAVVDGPERWMVPLAEVKLHVFQECVGNGLWRFVGGVCILSVCFKM